jgi:hypothetical protein
MWVIGQSKSTSSDDSVTNEITRIAVSVRHRLPLPWIRLYMILGSVGWILELPIVRMAMAMRRRYLVSP